MNAARALVTGGAGFVGSHLVDALLAKGVEVCVVDDLSTGSRANLAAHEGDPNLRFVEGDIRRVNSIKGIPDGIDVVFHEAAIASVPRSVEDPMTVHDVNVYAALETMNFCIKRGIRRFVFASSAAVYGAGFDPPAKEADLCAPGSPYGASKLSVENYMHAYQSSYGLETVALRYFNVYGPRQRSDDQYSGVIPLSARLLLASETPTGFGAGLQTRAFVHVRDVAAANLLAMEPARASGEVFNVATGREVTVLGLLEAMARATGTRLVRPRFAPARKGDLRVGSSATGKARRLLGFEAKVGLSEGLEDLLRHWGREEVVGVEAG